MFGFSTTKAKQSALALAAIGLAQLAMPGSAQAQGHTYTFTNQTGEMAMVKPQCIAADCPEFELPGSGQESIVYYKPYDYSPGWIGVCLGPDSHQVYTESAGRWSVAPVKYLTPDDYAVLSASIGSFLGNLGSLGTDVANVALASQTGGVITVQDGAFSSLENMASGPALWHQRNFCRNRNLELIQTDGGKYFLVARPE